MKLKDITNAYLIRLMESSTELFQTKKYFSKDHVNSFLGLGIHRSGFYGKQVGNTIVPLKLNQTNFDEPAITIQVEGVITLPRIPTNTGTIAYTGYGVLEVNGVPFFDGRGGNQTTPTSDDIANDSTIVGVNVTQALNTLGTDLDNLENDFTSLSTDDVSNDSNVPGSSSTIALNNLKIDVDDLKDNTFKVTYYEILDISSTTSGSLQSTPTGATINEDQFGDSGNSVLSTVTVASTPTYESPLVGEVPVTVNLGVNGSWVASNTYPDPVALIYSITIEFGDWDNVDNSKIIDYYQLERSIGTDLSLGTISATNLDVNSSTGDNVTLPPANVASAGLMSATDKSKLDNIEPNATADQVAVEVPFTPTGNTSSNNVQLAIEEVQTDLDGVRDDTILNNAKVSADGSVTTHNDVTSAGSGAIISTVERNKLSGIENGATADQTASEIKVSYESNANTNEFSDSEKSKLAGLESSRFKGTYVSKLALDTAHPTSEEGSYADVDGGTGQEVNRYIWDNDDSAWILQLGESAALTDVQIKTQYENNADTNSFTDSEKTKLSNQSNTNTGDETAGTIKTKYESNSNTNSFTDAEKTNLSNQSNTNSGDETTSSIQTKRPLKTVNGNSLEGSGNITTLTKVVSYSSIAINGFNSNALTNVSNMQVTIAKTGDYSFVSTINCSTNANAVGESTLAITPISSRDITLIDGTVQALTAGVPFSFVKQVQFDQQKKNEDQTIQKDFILNGLVVGDLIDVQLNTRGDNLDITNRWLTGFTV